MASKPWAQNMAAVGRGVSGEEIKNRQGECHCETLYIDPNCKSFFIDNYEWCTALSVRTYVAP